MILDFKDIQHDFYGKVEQPTLVIKTLAGKIISTVSNYFGLTTTFRFNDVSEVNFSVPAYHDGIKNNGYDEISGMRLIEVEPFGDFILVNPEMENDGVKETKTCKAYSLEYAFNYKIIEIPAGTYNFYNPADNTDTVISMILELMPDWNIGTIDRELIGRWRTFDTVDENLYSFMMNTLQESFNCLFLFDTKKKQVNVISANSSVSNLPIYLSYNNLVKSIDITELSDEVVTALSAYGSGDDVAIYTINPNGTNTIYNLDYYLSKGDIPEKLADRWIAYSDSLELYQQVFSNLVILYNQKINEKNLADAKLKVLETDYNAINEAYLTAQTTKGQNEDYDKEIEKLKQQLTLKSSEIEEQESAIAVIENNVVEINDQLNDIVSACKLSSYFTTDEMKILSQYFKHDSIAEDTFVIPEYSSAVLESNSNIINEESNGSVKIIGTEIYANNIAEVFKADENGYYTATTTDEESGEQIPNSNYLDVFNSVELPVNIAETVADQLNAQAKRKVYGMRGGVFKFEFSSTATVNEEKIAVTNTLSGDIVTVDFHYNTENLDNYIDENSEDLTKSGFFMLTATLRNAYYNGVEYPSMNVSMEGMLSKGIPNIGENFIGFDIKSAVFYNTASTTEYQKQSVLQELYDYAQDTLEKLAWPSYEFSVDSGNFVFAQEFEPFKNVLKLGSTVNLSLDDEAGNILKPILIELQLDYDNESSFSITFSNKYHSSDSEFKLADIITDAAITSHSLDINKANYSAYKDSKAGNQIDTLSNSAFDVAKRNIINSENQSIDIGSAGAFFRKKNSNGSFDPEQLGIIHNTIAFTKDNWNTVEIGIGKIFDENTGVGYGIAAPSIFGTLLAGNNLVIENTVLDETGAKIVKQFKVDGSGAWLNNASFCLSQEPDLDTGYPGGRILIDPRYGIAAGDLGLFTGSGSDIIPAFMDEEGNIIWDESKVIETENGSRYFVPNHTKFFFNIKTGDAYFGGDINAENIIAGTLNGNAIKEGSIDAGSKLTGDVNSDQIYKNVLDAINKYVNFQTENGQPVVQMDNAVIGNLTADNFEGNKIIANSISTEGLSANVIDAINASIGKISAEHIDVSAIDAGRIIVDAPTGKLLIDPDYGIAAGNVDLFTVNEDGSVSPSFMDGDGNLIIDSETKCPINSTLYFDIKTGRTYFAGEISAAQITSGKLSSDYLNIKDGYITNAMIENLSAEKINAGQISADVMTSNVISAINANVGSAVIDTGLIKDLTSDNFKGNTITANSITTDGLAANVIAAINASIGTATIDAAKIGNLDANYATIDFANIDVANINKGRIAELFAEVGLIKEAVISEGHVTGYLDSVSINANSIKAGTLSVDRLVINGSEESLIYALNNAGELTSTYVDALDGGLLADRTITADKLVAHSITANEITTEKLQGAYGWINLAQGTFNYGNQISFDGEHLIIQADRITTSSGSKYSTTEELDNAIANTVVDVAVYYALSDSTVIAPTTEWSVIAPDWEDGRYMWQKTVTIYANGDTEESDPTCIAGASGKDGEDAVTLRIDSSRGTVFKNNGVSTVLSVVIYKGSNRITNKTELANILGANAYLEWYWQRMDETSFGVISAADQRIGNDGFTFTLSADDVDTKVVFLCKLIVD